MDDRNTEKGPDLDADQMTGAQDEPQVIAEIHFNHSIDKVSRYIEEYQHCCLCGTELDFSQVTHFANLQVEEEAHCPACNIRHKKETHILQ